MREPIARVVKNGEERLVHTRAELVELRFDGWREVKDVVGKIRDGAEQLAGTFTRAAPEPSATGAPADAAATPATSLDLDQPTDDQS